MSATPVFVDTNIYCRVATQALPGCEMKHFDSLKRMVAANDVRLLVPEIILLELEKFETITFPKKLASEIDKLRSKIEPSEGWNELRSLRNEVVSEIARIRESYVNEVQARIDDITEFLRSDAVTQIPIDGETLLAAYRTSIRGGMPSEQKVNGDCLLVEALVAHFDGESPPREFHFCSENHSHFAKELESKSKDRQYRLHPALQARLPNAVYSINLEDLLAFANQTASPPSEDLPPVVLDSRADDWFASAPSSYCLTHEAIPFGTFLTYPTGSTFSSYPTGTAFSSAVPVVSGTTGLGSELIYEGTVTSPHSEIQVKTYVLHEIDALLRACRACKSWNHESEAALPKWLELVPEDQLVDAPMVKLHQIYLNLMRYLKRHKELDRSSVES